jgi:Polyketide cyclase / dehydrase and lipid transport
MPMACVLALFLLALPRAQAFELLDLDVHYGDDGFEVDLSAVLDARIDEVEAVLRDYAAYPDLDPRIEDAREIARPQANVALVYTKLRACAGIFCRTVRRVERVEERRHELIGAVLPERSDMKSGASRTVLTGEGDRTRISYRSSFEPDFWVPRLIGRRLMLRALGDATVDLFENVEQRATDGPAP